MATYNTIKQGSKGDDVKKLQESLISAGYDVGSSGADGIFGSKTAAAVKSYQKANGLSADGIVGNKTWGSLNSSSNNTNNNVTTTDANVTQATSKYNIGGVNDDAIVDKAFNNTFQASGKQTELDNKVNDQSKVLEGLVGQKDIINSKTMATINSNFSVSNSYKEAMKVTNQLLDKLTSGRTSYTDDVEAMMNKILNRESFEYDVDSDQLFQQALASAMNSGKSAMQDTIGQASALTGGYGSTYATSAGNQAYNAFIEDAYNNLPEYYQMALQAYQMEGDEMYRQMGMFTDADNREFQRTYDAWNANFTNSESLYNKEYGQYQDRVNNAFQSANLQLNEYGTRFDSNAKLYDAYNNQANTNYQREYQTWADSVAQAQNMVNTLMSDYQYDTNLAYQKERDAKEYALNVAKMKSSGRGGGGGSGDGNGKTPTSNQLLKALDAYHEDVRNGDKNLSKYNAYINSLSGIDLSVIDEYIATNGEPFYDEEGSTFTTLQGMKQDWWKTKLR